MKYYESDAARNLAAQFPWPDRPLFTWDGEPPTWFTSDVAEMLSRFVGPETRCIVELGSWYGGSARWLAEHAENALIVCIDHWDAYPEIESNPEWKALQPGAFLGFLSNLWEFRERVIPVRETTWWGMALAANAGIQADLVYIDADHTETGVLTDVCVAQRAFPGVAMVGDDWNRPEVQRGVIRGLRASGRDEGELINNGICWAVPGVCK